ncbi:gliding motility-associated C-terminal domain-containing protein [Mucilaginibacter agri]|uniref:T9SS type B sorting domain-containing protein n=1 Tax=Mucilaginibacter agri TaxID=2695265 RepID=A0A966DW52_9SPHI|nr:gliding motility-associated C-terminal domain-containing protein [Mucilaginibacter agri]NCD72142.1 T9SS type B sorting domain-containing protein [Mucilaginibacter agri]
MKIFTFITFYFLLIICLLAGTVSQAVAQRTFASTTHTGSSSVLCLGCTVTNAGNAADGNLQTYSTLNVGVGVAASTWEELLFPGAPTTKVPANTPVSIKLGSGDNLLSLQALGAISVQAYNNGTAIGSPIAASSLVSLLANNNQTELTFTPTQQYDRVRVTLNGGLVGALNSIYLYEAFYPLSGAVACNTAFDELDGVSSNLLGLGNLGVGGVQNPQNAIDGNPSTAATLNAGVGLVGAAAQETAIFSNVSTVGDSVRLTISLPQALIDAGVTSNISVTTFNGNTSNNDTQTLSGGLLTLRLLDAATGRQTVTFAPTSTFDRVQVTLGGGIANVLSSMNLYEVQRVIPRPIVKFNNVVAENVQLCTGGSAALTVTAVPNTTFTWYTTATGGSPVATGTSFTAGPLNTTTTYYVQANRTGCTDASDRTPVIITVNTIPTAPVVANNAITICPGQTATFNATAVTGVTVNWYAAATGGTPIASGNTFTTPALNTNTTYYAEAVSGGTCTSPTRTAVTVSISTLPVTPVLTTANPTICDGDVAVLAVNNPVTGETYNWYSAATGGTLLGTGVNFTTPALHSNTNYYVEAVNSTGCSSVQRAQATVTVSPLPTDPILSANNTTVVAGQTAAVSVTNAQTGVNYNWYTSATASTPVFTGNTYTTPQLYVTTTYYVGGTNGSNCTSASRIAITINVTINNNTPCSFANVQTQDINGLCIGCNITNAALSADADTTTASTVSVLAGLVGGYAGQQLVFQQPGLAGDTIKLGLQSNANLLTAAVAGSVQVIVYNGTTQVATYALDNSLIKVRLLGGGTGRYIVTIPATAAYDRVTVRLNSGVAGLISTLQIYYAQQIFQRPVINPLSPEICKGSSATLNITSPSSGTFTWYDAPTGGTIVHTGASFTTPALNANTTYYVEYSRNGCTSPVRFPVTILVNDVPAAPAVAANNVTIISGQTATLVGTAPTNATITWYAAATGGTSLATGNNFTTPPLTANTTYYAESTSGTCTSTTRTPVTVTVTPIVIPDITVTPPTQTINPGETTAFTASSTTPGAVFNWFTTPTGGTSIFTGATFTTPAEFSNTTFYAEATVPATGAVSATRGVGNVVVNQTGVSPVACDAAISQTTDVNGLVCVNCTVNNPGGSVDNDRNTFSQLNVLAGLVGAYVGQTLRFAATGHAADSVIVELGVPGSLASVGLLSNISIATYNGTTYNNDRFNVNGGLLHITLLNGTNRFRVAFAATADFDRVEIRNNSAVGVLSSLNIYDATQEVAAPVISAASPAICAGSQGTITATASNNATIKWYTAATGGNLVATGPTFTTPVLTATTTYYAEATRTADGCVQAVRTPTTVTVNPVPVAPVVATNNVTICAGSTATFNAQAVTGVTVNWYDAPTAGNLVGTGNSFTSPALTTTTSYYAEAVSTTGSCPSTAPRTQVTATVNNAIANPVVAQTTVPVCAGSPAVLTATSPQAGVIFNWYTVATGGTPVFTGAQYTTPAVTANTAYYVEASAGTCVSPNRVEVDVTATPLPAAPTVVINPANAQVQSGQTATLTASSTTSGATFNWYTAATGGTPIATGATFTTPALTSTTTYYAESISPTGGCPSTTRTAATITVVPVFSTSCDFASSQTNDVNGGALCAGCGIDNPNNAVDNNLTNFSHMHILAGVAGSYVAQTLIFGESGTVGDSVTVALNFPAAIISAGLLNRISIASFNGATNNGDAIFLDNNLIKVQVLANGTSALIRFAPQAAFDRVVVTLNSALLGVNNSVDILYASKQVEKPQLAVSTQNICSGADATFTVSNARAGVTYQWYDASTGGTLVHTGNTYTATNVAATTTYYVQSVRSANSCPNPNRVAATINVTPSPVNAVVSVTGSPACSGDQVTLTVTNAGTNTVNWYDAATGGTLVFTGPVYTVSPIASVTYYAELANGTCTSPARTAGVITVNPRPSAPGVVSNNVSVCTGSTATLAVLSPEANVTYNWYTTATGGTIAGTGTSFTTPTITANTTYYVEAVSTSGCTNNGGRTAVNVTTNGQIAAPTLSATTTSVCAGGSASVSVVNPIAGLQYNFYTVATGGTPVFTGTTLTLNNVTANATYYVEASNGTCTSATRTQTDITVIPAPTPPQVVIPAGGNSVCVGSSAVLNILNPQTNMVYRWYDAATNGTLLFTGTEFHTPALTVNATYYVEAAQAGNCNPSTRTAVPVTVNGLPADPTLAAANVPVCLNGNATLAVSSPQPGITYQWFDEPTLTHLVFAGATFVVNNVTANATYYVRASNATGCTSANAVTAQITIQQAPAAPLVAEGTTVQSCAGSQVTLNISNPQTGLTYNWYTAAAGGSPVNTGVSFTTGMLSANAVYYVEAANSTGCPSATRTEVDITVTPLPTAPTVTAQGGSTTPSVCSGANAVLVATSVTPNVSFNWYTAATGGTPIFTGPTYTTDPLTANTTYYVEAVTNTGSCASTTRTSVQVTISTTTATAPQVNSADLTACQNSTTTIHIVNPDASTTYNWYTTATGGSPVFTGTAYTTGQLTANTTFYVEAANPASCNPSARTTAAVTVNSLPADPTLAAASVPVCLGATATLAVNSPQVGVIYHWYDDAAFTHQVALGATFTTGAINTNTTFYVRAFNANGCISANAATAQVTISPAPGVPVIANGSTAQSCAGSQVTLNISNPQVGITYNWYTTATGGTVVATGPSFTTGMLSTNATYYAEAVNATGCASNTRAQVDITVTPLPVAPTVTAQGGSTTPSVCSGTTAVLVATSTTVNVSFNWYTVATGGTPVFTGPTYTTDPLTANTTYYVEAVTNTGSCASTTRTPVQVTISTTTATAPQVNAADLTACQNSTTTIHILNPDASTTYNWYTAATGGSPVFTGIAYTTNPLTANTTFYVEAVNPSSCNPSLRTTAAVTVNSLPADPTLVSANPTICAGATAPLAVNSPQGGITYQWFDDVALTHQVATGATFTTGPISNNTTYYVRAVNSNGCNSANPATAQVIVSPTPGAPVVANGSTVQSCSGASVVLSISNPQSGFVYNWYAAATGGSPVSTGISFNTAALTTSVTYYAEAVNATGCTSGTRTQVDINVNPAPVAPVVTAQGGATNPSVCLGSSAILVATSTTSNVTFNWYTTATGGTAVFTGPTYTTDPLTANTTFYVEAVSNNGGCISANRGSVQVTINNTTAPQPQVNAADLTICQNSAAIIHITNPDASTTYNWYAAATGGTAVFTGPVYTTGALTSNTTYYVEAVNSQSCSPSTRLAVNVNVGTQPATPVPSAATVAACAGSGATLTVSSPQAGTVYNWYDSPSKTNLLGTGASFTTGPITANATYYVDATSGSCTSPSVGSVQVTVNPIPAAPMVVNGAVSACTSSQVTLSVSNPMGGSTYNWYTAATGGAPVYTGTDFTTPVLSANTTFYVEAVNAGGCSSATRTPATVTVSGAPGTPVIAGNKVVCPGSTTTLTATSSDPNAVITWYSSATGGTALSTGASFTTPSISANITYYAQATNAGGCSSTTRSPATITVYAAPVAPTVTATVTATSITFQWTGTTGATSYLISLDNGLTFITPSSGINGLTHTIANLLPNKSISIVVKAVGPSPCSLNAVSSALTAITSNPLGDDVFVPNAFTPNGDGKNDVLNVFSNSIKKIDFWVYDQWGEMQYHSNTQGSGWDGSYKGKPQPVGVYVYYLEATMDDGQTIKKKGTINLIR